jgi:hypothetical protein
LSRFCAILAVIIAIVEAEESNKYEYMIANIDLTYSVMVFSQAFGPAVVAPSMRAVASVS